MTTATKPVVIKGYYIRIIDERGMTRGGMRHCWGKDASLPTEWQELAQDSSVEHAQLFRADQRHRRADKRRITASYQRAEQAQAS